MNRFNALATNSSSSRPGSSRKKSKKDSTSKSSKFNSFRQAKPTENTRFPKPSSSDSLSSMVSRSSTPSPTNDKRFTTGNNNRFKAFNNRKSDRSNRRNHGNAPSPRERQPTRNSFNWKKKEAEKKERERMKKIERSEENFPTLGGKPNTTTIDNTVSDVKDEEKTTNKLTYKGLLTYKKSKRRQEKPQDIPDGWVKLKLVNGKIQKRYGKPIVRRQRKPNTEKAMQTMFDGVWETMETSWNDGFWDSRQNQLEELIDSNLYNSDDSQSDEEYFSDDFTEEEEELNTHLGRTKRS